MPTSVVFSCRYRNWLVTDTGPASGGMSPNMDINTGGIGTRHLATKPGSTLCPKRGIVGTTSTAPVPSRLSAAHDGDALRAGSTKWVSWPSAGPPPPVEGSRRRLRSALAPDLPI